MLEEIRNECRAQFDGHPGRLAACEAVINYLESQPLDELRYVPFMTLIEAAGSMENGIPVCTFLSTCPSPFLELCYEYCPEQPTADFKRYYTRSEMSQADIRDQEDRIYIIFKPTERYLDLVNKAENAPLVAQ